MQSVVNAAGVTVKPGRGYVWKGTRVIAGSLFQTDEGPYVAIHQWENPRERRNVPADELEARPSCQNKGTA